MNELFLEEFCRSVDSYLKASFAGDNSMGMKSMLSMQRIALDAFGSDAGSAGFSKLFEHDSPWVRLFAASFALRIRNSESLDVLRNLASSSDKSVAFEAKQCIRAWEAGEWALDVPIEAPDVLSGESVGGESIEESYRRLRELPSHVPLAEVLDVDDIYVRIGLVNIHFVNIVGVNKGSVSFCPNLNSVSDDERIAWAFVVYPTLAKTLLERVEDSDFKGALADFFEIS